MSSRTQPVSRHSLSLLKSLKSLCSSFGTLSRRSKILNICPRVKGEYFTEVLDDDSTLTFLINLGYKGPIHKHPSMYVDHIHQPWRTLADIINKCLSGKTASNDSLRKYRIDILWGMFYRETIDYPDKRVIKKEVLISTEENIILEPDITLEFGKSMSLTEAAEEEAARLVHATHERIVTKSDPEPANGSQSHPGGSSKGTSTKPGVPNESIGILSTSSEGTGTKPGVLDEEKGTSTAKADVILDWGSEEESEYYATKTNVEKTEELKDDNTKARLPPTSFNLSVSSGFVGLSLSMLNVPISMIPELSILPPIFKTTTTSSPVISTITHVLQQQSTPIPTPPITIEALTFIIAVPKTLTIITTAFNDVQLRVADLEKDVMELKKVDLSTEILTTIRLRRKQADKQKMTKYTIKSTNKAALNEYYLKHVLFQSMNDSKSFNKNPKNKALYHSLMEALITNEEAMDKGIADSLKQHKKSHGDEDEDPSARPKKANKSVTIEEMVEEPINELIMDDVDHTTVEEVVQYVDQPQDTSEPKTDKTSNWLTQPPRPPTPDPEWNIVQIVDDSPEEPWFNNLLSAEKDPLTFDALMATLIDFSKFAMNRLKIDKLTKAHLVGPVYKLLKGTCKSSIELEYKMEECFKALTDKLDWNNPEGDLCTFDLTKPLPLKDPKKYTTSITKTKAARYEIVGIENIIPTLWSATNVGYNKDALKIHSVVTVKLEKLHGYGHLEEIVVRRVDRQLYKFKEGNFIDLHLNDIEDKLIYAVQHKLFQLDESDIVDFIVALSVDKRRSGLMVDLIDKKILERRIMRNLERWVGARELEMDY
nr:hypothetical protein [Tanacetum cinerariifolium]